MQAAFVMIVRVRADAAWGAVVTPWQQVDAES
jgi:hypothetical protein